MQPQNSSYNRGEYDSSGVGAPAAGASVSTGAVATVAADLDDRSRFRSPAQEPAVSYGSLDVVPPPAPAVATDQPSVAAEDQALQQFPAAKIVPAEPEPEELGDTSLESRMATDSLEPVAAAMPLGQEDEAALALDRSENAARSTASRGDLSLFHYNRVALLTTVAAMLAIVLIGVGGWLLTSLHKGGSGSPQSPSSYAVGSNLQLNGVKNNQDLKISGASQLTVNGQLQVSNALTLKPISRPSDPSSGQIYYDKTGNALYFYNGKQFLELGGGVSSLGGSKGAITLGNGLVMTGGQLSVSSTLLQASQQNINPGSYVASLQGRTGDVTLVGGAGIDVNGTVISNNGVVSLSSGSANLVVTSNGAGHYIITDTSGGSGVVSITGTANQVQVSSSTGNVTLSLPQDIAAGSSPTFSNLHLGSSGVFAGGLILANASNANTATLYSDPLGQSTIYTLPDPHQASVDICLSSGNCAGTGGGLIGSGSANHIAKFTNGNTLADSGLTEAGSTLTYAGNVVVNADGSFTGNLLNLEVGGSSKLSVNEHGDTTQGGTLTVNGTGASSIAGSLDVGTGLTVTSGGAAIAGDSVIVGTLTGLTGLSSSGTVTLSGIGGPGVVHSDGSGNLTSSAVVLGSDTSGDYVARLGTLNGLTVTGNSGAGSTPGLSVAYGSAAGTAVQGSTTLTCASGTGNLSGGGNIITLGSGGTCSNLSITASPTFTGSVTVGNAGTSDGSLILANGTNSNLTTLQSAAVGQNQTIVIPDSGAASDEVCLVDLGNCAGSGGGVTGTGTAGTIALFSGSHIIGNSAITQTGTGPTATVTVAGTLAATYLQGDGSAITNLDGSNIGSGTVANTYLTNGGKLTVIAGTGLSGGGNVALGGSTTLSVAYGSAAGTAVQGSTTLTCASGTGNLSGGGNIITLGSGGTCSNLSITASPTFTGSVTVGNAGTSDGSLILANGTNSNLTTLQSAAVGQNQTIVIPDSGAASDEVCLVDLGNCAGSGGGVTGTGTAGTIALFSGSHIIGNSAITQTGTGPTATVTVAGTLAATYLQGANSLSLGTSSSSTGSISFANASNSHTLTLQSGASGSDLTLTLPTSYGGNGNCLITDGSGNLSFQSCTGGAGGGVTSLNSLTGILTLQGTTGQINVSDDGVGTITLSLPQDIAIASSPQFDNLILTGNLTLGALGAADTASLLCLNSLSQIASCTGTGSGTPFVQGGNSLGATGVLGTNDNYGLNIETDGNTALALDTSGNGTLTGNLTVSGTGTSSIGGGLSVGGNVTGGSYNGATISSTAFNNLTLNGTTITGGGALSIASGGTNQNISLNASGSGTVGIGGASTGNILLGGGSSSTGCTLTNATGDFYCAGTVKADSNIQSVNGSIQALNGNIDSTRATAGNNAFTANVSGDSLVRYQVNADGKIQWGDGTNALDTNLYRGSAGQLNTDGSLYVNQTLGVGGTINGQTIGSASTFTGTVAIQGANALTLGTASSHTGAIIFNTAAGGNTITLQGPSVNPGGNYTLSIPNITGNDTICTVGLGNCNSLSGSGTPGTLAMFTGTGTTVASSILSQSANTLTAAGNVIINAATGFTGNLINLEVNSNSKLSVDQSGNSVQAGTLSVNGTGTSSIAGSLSVGVLGTNGTSSLCSNAGTISTCASTGTQGFWTRTGTTLQPANSGDTITTSGSIATTGNGNVTVGSVGGTATLTVNGSQGSISTSTTGNNLNFSRAGSNYIEATDSSGTLRLGAGSHSNNLIVNTDGSVLLQDATGDSPNAFQVQSAGGASLININSQSKIINVGGAVATVTITPAVAPSGGGTVGSWNTTTALPAAVYGAATVAYNGYMYQLGGYNGSAGISTTYSAPINANGTLGSWTSRTALPTTLYNATAVVYNGYVYVMGGYTGSSELATVYYAQLTNGVIGAWNTTTSLPSARQLATSAVNNGYVYILAGSTSGTAQTSVNFAPINANGTLGTWYTATSLPAARAAATTVISNGYIYEVTGGATPSCTPDGTNTAYYAAINGDGTIGSWTSGATVPDTRYGAGAVAWGSHLYIVGGVQSGGACAPGYLYHDVNINLDGSLGSWNAPSAVDQVFLATTVAYNGYMYMLGGTTNGTTNTTSNVYYVSVSGSQGSAASQTVNPNDGNNVNYTQEGNALFQNATDSATSFQIQNASATDLFTVDTLNNRVIVGTASSTPTLLILGTKNTLGDPTCVSGGMYYNSSTGQAKVCLGGSWAAVGVPTVTSLPVNPSDGDEVYYKVYVNGQLSGNTGYWHLRYNASTGYWDFLGGPALSSTDSTTHTTSSSSYASSSAYDYLPLNGDYDVSYGSQLVNDAANALNQMQVGLSQTGTTVHTCYFIAVSQFNGSSLNCSYRLTGITGAGGTNKFVQDLYMSLSGQSSNFYPLYVNVTPIRVK